MKKKAKSKKTFKTKAPHTYGASPMLEGISGLTPFALVIVFVVFTLYTLWTNSPQERLVEISFNDNEKIADVARIMLEGDDPQLAKLIYSKMIDGMNISSNEGMSMEWTDDMILRLNPRSGLSEDIRTKTLMSESIKSKALYERLAKLFAQIGFTQNAREFENKAKEIDPAGN